MKVDYLSCTGCGACVNICPTDAIIMRQNEEGFLYPYCQEEKCIGCGQCTQVCSNFSFMNGEREKLCLAAQASDDIRQKSSSGGVFSLLASHIIREGGCVCGAIFDNKMKVHHYIVDNEKELKKLRTSKYVQSCIGMIYREIKGLLIDKQKRVLFSGTPCQVSGLYQYLGEKPENLYTIDVLCHGVPPQRLFDRYLQEEYPGEAIRSINFRDKSNGWTYKLRLRVETEQNTYLANIDEDMYYRAFNSRLSLRYSCGICKFASSDRVGDISLGDFWEIWTYDRVLDDRKGTSLVLLNSEKGECLFQNIVPKLCKCDKVPINVATRGNVTLLHPVPLHKNRETFFNDLRTYSFGEAAERNIGEEKKITPK